MIDQSVNKRLFVGGLAEEVTPEMLKKKFKSFGIIDKIDIHRKKSLTDDSTNVFAFLDFSASQQNLNKCLEKLNNSTWDGKVMRIQIARESFMDRLAAERKQNNNNVTNKIDVNVNKNSVVKEWSRHGEATNVDAIIQKNLKDVKVVGGNKINIQIKRKNGYPSSSDDSDDDDDEDVKAKKNPLSANKVNDDNDDDDSTSYDSSSSDAEAIEGTNSNSLKKSSSKPLKQFEALKARKRKADDEEEEEDTDDDDDDAGKRMEKKAKKIKTDYEEKIKNKLNKSREEEAEKEMMMAEKKRSMEILNSVVKIRPEKRQMSALGSSVNEVRRFDPTKPGHVDLVVNQNNKVNEKSHDDDDEYEKSSKTKKRKMNEEEEEDTKKEKAGDRSKEEGTKEKRYAEVAPSVVGAFKRSETFKLTSLFESDDDDDDDAENYCDAPAAKKPKLAMDSMFGWNQDNNKGDDGEYDDDDDDREYNNRYNDDDDDDDDDDDSMNVKTSRKMAVTKKTKETDVAKDNKTQKKVKKFFFDENDPKLLKGGNFHRTEDLEELRKKWEEDRPYYVESYRLRKRRYRALR